MKICGFQLLCGGGMVKSKGENQELGNWKLRNACNQKLQVGHRPGTININSPICERVADSLAEQIL